MVKLVLAPNEYGYINNNEMFSFKDRNLLNMNEVNPLDLRRGLVNKNNLIKLLHEYGNHKVKNYLVQGYNAFCKYEKNIKKS